MPSAPGPSPCATPGPRRTACSTRSGWAPAPTTRPRSWRSPPRTARTSSSGRCPPWLWFSAAAAAGCSEPWATSTPPCWSTASRPSRWHGRSRSTARSSRSPRSSGSTTRARGPWWSRVDVDPGGRRRTAVHEPFGPVHPGRGRLGRRPRPVIDVRRSRPGARPRGHVPDAVDQALTLPAVGRPQPAALRPQVRSHGRFPAADPPRPVHLRVHRPGPAARPVRGRPGALPVHERPLLQPGVPGEALTVRMWREGEGEALFQTVGPDGRVVLDAGSVAFDGAHSEQRRASGSMPRSTS